MYLHHGPRCNFGSQLPAALHYVCLRIGPRFRMDQIFRSSYSLPSDTESYSEEWTGNSSRSGTAVDWQYTGHVTDSTNSSTGVLFFDSSQYSCFSPDIGVMESKEISRARTKLSLTVEREDLRGVESYIALKDYRRVRMQAAGHSDRKSICQSQSNSCRHCWSSDAKSLDFRNWNWRWKEDRMTTRSGIEKRTCRGMSV